MNIQSSKNNCTFFNLPLNFSALFFESQKPEHSSIKITDLTLLRSLTLGTKPSTVVPSRLAVQTPGGHPHSTPSNPADTPSLGFSQASPPPCGGRRRVEATHVVDPGDVGAHTGEDGRLLGVVAAHAGAEAHHPVDVPGPIGVLAVQGSTGVSLEHPQGRQEGGEEGRGRHGLLWKVRLLMYVKEMHE